MLPFDLSLYLVTDNSYLKGRALTDIVKEAIAGGVTMVQLREKESSSIEFYRKALAIKEITKAANIPLIINDRVDIALAVDADGLHIGQSDLPYAVVRKMLGYDKIIGLSVETIEQAKEANNLDVDYIGISPVFSTPSKTNTYASFGIEGIKEIASFTKHPTVAIGGINLSNAKEIMDAGANGIAVISAIIGDKKPKEASKLLMNQIKLSE